MKVYVVTRGSYSDYGISKVFLDKKKAERYVKLSQHQWDTPRIETYETHDDSIIEKITYVDANYSKGRDSDDVELNVDIKITNSLDETEDGVTRTMFWYYKNSKDKEINIQRVIHGDFEEELVINKYKKACIDMMTEIESLLELEGWTEEMVELWIKDNLDNYLK